MKKALVRLSVAVATVAAAATVTPAAHASGGPIGGPTVTYAVTNVQTYTGQVNYSELINSVTNSGRTTITGSVSVGTVYTTTVEVAFSVTKAWVAGQLTFSLSKSTSTTATCTASLLPGQTLYMYPKATKKYYKVKQTSVSSSGAITVSYSGTLTAWQPETGVACVVA